MTNDSVLESLSTERACSSCGAAIGLWDRCTVTVVDGRRERRCSKCAPLDPRADIREALKTIEAQAGNPPVLVLSPAQAENLARIEKWLRSDGDGGQREEQP